MKTKKFEKLLNKLYPPMFVQILSNQDQLAIFDKLVRMYKKLKKKNKRLKKSLYNILDEELDKGVTFKGKVIITNNSPSEEEDTYNDGSSPDTYKQSTDGTGLGNKFN